MITTTPSRILERRRSSNRGYTLLELMLSTGLSAMVLAGVLSTFLFLSRSGATMQNYNEMELQSRRGLEYFAEDVRQASAITWNSNVSVTLTVNSVQVIYAYDSVTRAFTRNHAVEGNKVLITNITPGTFQFRAFKINTEKLDLDTADQLITASNDTKQLQISLEAFRSRSVLATTTNKVLSARYILRNKPVSA
jgi:Prokaryotic N-terminal methylation motif